MRHAVETILFQHHMQSVTTGKAGGIKIGTASQSGYADQLNNLSA